MTAVSIPWAVQVAVFDRLTAHIAAAGKSWPVFDHVPQNQPASFVQIGPIATPTDDILAAELSLVVVTLIAWSSEAGKKEAHQMAAEIRAALHEQELPLASGTAYHVAVDRQFIDRDDAVPGFLYQSTTILTVKVEH